MAKTSKSDHIRKAKDDLIYEIDRIREAIRIAAQTVPEAVLNGDALIAAKWKQHADGRHQYEGDKVANHRKTEQQLIALLDEEKALLATLNTPAKESDQGFVPDVKNLDLFAA